MIVAPSCSLLHCPEDLAAETGWIREIAGWLSFARQKLDEVALIARALNAGRTSVAAELAENARLLRRPAQLAPRRPAPPVRERLATLTPQSSQRGRSRYTDRRKRRPRPLPCRRFPLPPSGHFPQTQKVRATRAAFRPARSPRAVREVRRRRDRRTVRLQESLGLDVLVHGEFERNDMVEYFGEMLSGFAFTRNGWVQSYGSRCVKPPIIYGDVERPEPMTVRWSAYAQSLTEEADEGNAHRSGNDPRVVVRPRRSAAGADLPADRPRHPRRGARLGKAAGIRLIQIDEPALREGLPLRAAERDAYLDWAVESFRIASSGVEDGTQIHTHMCYSEFNDIVAAIAAMDADVLSVESARSRMELLGAFQRLPVSQRDRAGGLRHPLSARSLVGGDPRSARRRRWRS